MDIVRRIPWELTSRTVGGANYQLGTDSFDIAIGGIPFLLGTSDQRPYLREIENSRKDMFDNFAEPGEYSLTDWWLRSQQDWGGGQGLIYQDPDVDERFNLKYKMSAGINPWVPGQIQLLPQAIPVTNTVESNIIPIHTRGYRKTSGAHAAWVIGVNFLKSYDPIANTETDIDFTGPDPLNTPLSLTNSGDRYYVATDTAIYTGVDTAAGTSIWTYADAGGTGDVVVEWVKGRLMLGRQNAIYELAGTGPALPTASFSHLNPAWRWRSFTEGPNAIYAVGDDGTTSTIYKLVLETDGAVPTLASGGTITAVFPPGEVVRNIYQYLGTFVGISTNMGFRVGEIDSNGDINYGPLLWNLDSDVISGYDRFFYVMVNDGIRLDPNEQDLRNPTPTSVVGGLYRVDLGQRIQDQETGAIRYAYATDVYSQHVRDQVIDTNEPIRTFCILSNRFIFGIYGNKDNTAPLLPMYINYWPTDYEAARSGGDDYDLVEDGWIQTGRVRYNTLEPKLFRYFSVRSPAPLMGNIDVDALDEEDTPTRYITYTSAMPPDVGDIPLTGMDVPKTYMSLRFTLHRNSDDATMGAIMLGWQIKGLPAPIRQRLFTMSLICFDFEQDKTGQSFGYEGYSKERFEALESIAQAGQAILLQDLYNGTLVQVVIQQYQFVQLAPPGPLSSNYGGYITLQVKTVADVVM